MVLYSNYTMLQSTIFQGALYSATYVTVATLAFVAICFFPVTGTGIQVAMTVATCQCKVITSSGWEMACMLGARACPM